MHEREESGDPLSACALYMLVLSVTASAFVAPASELRSATCTPRHAYICATTSTPASGISSTTWKRAKDVFGLEEGASTEDVVNVIGRWTTWQQWDGIGELEEMDKLFTPEGVEIAKLKRQQSTKLLSARPGNGDWVKKTPQRRGWCLRNKLVQRYWMGENVGLLPFTDEKLAASVGKTAAEMNTMPINPLAADVVFDALSTSNAGILARSVCDEQRASFQDADGSFNERKFSDDLFRGKLKVIRSFCIFPGTIFLLQAGLFYKLDGWHATEAWVNQFLDIILPAYFGIQR